MLVHADVKGLELVTAAYLSGDPVLSQELAAGVDIHADNMAKFGMADRRDAKIFVFKLIYGGTSFGFAKQADFAHISTRQKDWDDLIETFYSKYAGIRKWHEALVRTVVSTGKLVMPTGREFHFSARDVVERLWFWKPKILNYPVQGTGADLVCIGRVTAAKRLAKAGISALWQSTVHDSIDLDVPVDISGNPCYNNVCQIVKESIADVPKNFWNLFGTKFDLPIGAEIAYGPTLGELTPYE